MATREASTMSKTGIAYKDGNITFQAIIDGRKYDLTVDKDKFVENVIRQAYAIPKPEPVGHSVRPRGRAANQAETTSTRLHMDAGNSRGGRLVSR